MHPTEESFRRLNERFQEWLWENYPLAATQVGIHRYDHRLADYTPDGVARREKAVRNFLKELEDIPADKLPLETWVDYRLLHSRLKGMERNSLELKTHQTNPSLYLNSGMMGIYLMLIRNYAPLEERMASVRDRLQEYIRVLEEGQQQLDQPPPVFVETALLSLAGVKGFFSTILPTMVEDNHALKEDIDKGCREVVEALNRFEKFLESLRENCQGEFAVGKDIFDRMLKEEHFLEYTTETLLEKGQNLVEETQKEMEKVSREIDPGRHWKEIIADTKKVHPSEGELLDFYRQECNKVKEFVRENDLVDLLAGELIIEETPEPVRPIIPYAAYLPPGPLEKDQTGRFWVTPVDPNKNPQEKEAQLGEHSRYSVPVIVLHEGYPGHHLQMCYSNRAPSLLKKTAQSTLFVEGWAFYCEELMEQQGYLKDPRIRLNRLKDQLWRACRIVADVSLHTGQMNFDQAVDYMEQVALLERNSAITEVRRYTSSPTQPMSYLIGKLEILKIVNSYREKKGKNFCLKDFHQELLSYGSLPPKLIRELLFS